MTMRLRSLTSLAKAPTASDSPSFRSTNGQLLERGAVVLSTRLGVAGAVLSVLALSACTDNYITNKYYIAEDSGAAPSASEQADAAVPSTEPSTPVDPSTEQPGTEQPGT